MRGFRRELSTNGAIALTNMLFSSVDQKDVSGDNRKTNRYWAILPFHDLRR